VQLVDLLTRVVEFNEIHARPGAGRRPPRRKRSGTAAKSASRGTSGRAVD
jgi:ribosomal protein L4